MKYFTVQFKADRVLSVLVEAKSRDEAVKNISNVIKCEEITKSEYEAFKQLLKNNK